MIHNTWLRHAALIVTGLGFFFIAYQLYVQGYSVTLHGRAIYTPTDASHPFWLDVATHMLFGFGCTVVGTCGCVNQLLNSLRTNTIESSAQSITH